MNAVLLRLLKTMLEELNVRVEALVAERDALKRERDELRCIIEAAGRTLAGERKHDGRA